MRNQKWKLKIEIQKSNSKMGIVLISSKTKFNFPSGLAFLFCEAIITQPFRFVNRRKKFFHTHLHNHLHCHSQMQKQSHLHWHNHIHIHIHLHTAWRFCVYLLMGWWVDAPVFVVRLYVYSSIQTSLNPSTYPQNFAHESVYGFIGWLSYVHSLT